MEHIRNQNMSGKNVSHYLFTDIIDRGFDVWVDMSHRHIFTTTTTILSTTTTTRTTLTRERERDACIVCSFVCSRWHILSYLIGKHANVYQVPNLQWTASSKNYWQHVFNTHTHSLSPQAQIIQTYEFRIFATHSKRHNIWNVIDALSMFVRWNTEKNSNLFFCWLNCFLSLSIHWMCALVSLPLVISIQFAVLTLYYHYFLRFWWLWMPHICCYQDVTR